MGLVVLLLLLSGLSPCSALVQHLSVKGDTRKSFFIENFGFEAGGMMTLVVENFNLNSEQLPYGQIGFLLARTTSNNPGVDDTDSTCLPEVESRNKLQTAHIPTEYFNNRTLWGEPFDFEHTITVDEEGLLNLYFYNCPTGDDEAEVTFDLQVTCVNTDGNYLSIGKTNLPTMYLFFFFAFVGLIVAWVHYIVKKGTEVYTIHHLMTVVLVLKAFTMLFLSLKFYHMKATGHHSGWNAAYYIFASLKGVMMFMVVALIGSGWAFIKPYLNDKDKKIFLVVLPLQIIANIAMIVAEEADPGSTKWYTWSGFLKVVDVLCCGAILFPVLRSISHLRDAAGTDGKAARNMEKLKLFRQFYIMMVAYIYFTRIIVYLFDTTVPYRYAWVSSFSAEVATLAFYTITGYKFRPVENNPYLHVNESDEEEAGVPLDDVLTPA